MLLERDSDLPLVALLAVSLTTAACVGVTTHLLDDSVRDAAATAAVVFAGLAAMIVIRKTVPPTSNARLALSCFGGALVAGFLWHLLLPEVLLRKALVLACAAAACMFAAVLVTER